MPKARPRPHPWFSPTDMPLLGIDQQLRACLGETKTCVACDTDKPLREFAVKRRGHASMCKPCAAEWQRRYRRDHRDRVAEADHRRRGAGERLESYRARRREHYRKNRARIRAQAKARYDVKYAVDPSSWRAAKARRQQRTTRELTALDRSHSIAYRAAIRDDPCWYCRRSVEGEMADDHFFPLAKGGTDHWWNLVRSCRSCNSSKNAHCGTWFLLKRGPRTTT